MYCIFYNQVSKAKQDPTHSDFQGQVAYVTLVMSSHVMKYDYDIGMVVGVTARVDWQAEGGEVGGRVLPH